MALANTIQSLTTRVAQEFNSVRAEIANNSSVVYTKTEVDSALLLKADVTYVDSALLLKANSADVYVKSDVYTKTEVDSALGLKADQSTTYTKTEVDSALLLKANSADVYVKSDVYTKTEVDSAITAGVASVIDSSPAALDTLNELAAALGNDANFATTVATNIGLKADQATTYTKTEVDNLLSPITGELSDLGALDLVTLFEGTLV